MSSNLGIALQSLAPRNLRDYRDIAASVRKKSARLDKLSVLEGRFLAAADKLIEKYDGFPEMSSHFLYVMERVSSGHNELCDERDRLENSIEGDRKLYPQAFS